MSVGDSVGQLTAFAGKDDRDVILGIGEMHNLIERSRDPCVGIILAPSLSLL